MGGMGEGKGGQGEGFVEGLCMMRESKGAGKRVSTCVGGNAGHHNMPFALPSTQYYTSATLQYPGASSELHCAGDSSKR
jgi:hypothetical protein